MRRRRNRYERAFLACEYQGCSTIDQLVETIGVHPTTADYCLEAYHCLMLFFGLGQSFDGDDDPRHYSQAAVALHKDPDLTVSDLAKRLNVSENVALWCRQAYFAFISVVAVRRRLA